MSTQGSLQINLRQGPNGGLLIPLSRLNTKTIKLVGVSVKDEGGYVRAVPCDQFHNFLQTMALSINPESIIWVKTRAEDREQNWTIQYSETNSSFVYFTDAKTMRLFRQILVDTLDSQHMNVEVMPREKSISTKYFCCIPYRRVAIQTDDYQIRFSLAEQHAPRVNSLFQEASTKDNLREEIDFSA